ncbi:Tudor/PWWP/MBT superfamily protein [Hirschfeldia incana]|nr:Tudor/PWWP/MBT superfamily protein [Hirschfeldia incana]
MGNFLTTGFRVSEYREEAGLIVSSEENDVNMESVNDSGPDEDYLMSEDSSSLNSKQDHSRDEFHVGDFVWVGVNRHQWWPGKIYDTSDASDLALKQMQNGTLLVALCRKETFVWCTPSQLKPFIENFRDFSKSSDSSSFLNAVREAVREIGQHVENLLVCNEPLVSSVAVNSGVKEGVLVPDVRRETVTSLLLEKPGIVLEDVKSLAKEASFGDVLEVEVLKSKISAFYRSRGRFGLAKYDDENPYIIGLEDKEDSLKLNNYSCQRSLRKCSVFASKKRKHGGEVLADIAMGDIRKRSEKREESGIDIVVDLSTPVPSLCKRVKVGDVSSSVEKSNGSGETIVQRGKRERKKSKYLSSEYMTDFGWRRRKSKLESESAEKIMKHSAEKVTSFVRFGATTEEILELIRAAALSTPYSQECRSSYDLIREFVSIYRSFTYVSGANYKRNVSDEDKVKKREIPENANENKGVTVMEWLKKKLEDMRALVDEAEGGEVTEELKKRLEEESRNLLDKVRKMTVGSSS